MIVALFFRESGSLTPKYPLSAQLGLGSHSPQITEADDGVVVTIGEVEHPMLAIHYIEVIEIGLDDGTTMTVHLYPGMKPSAFFKVSLSNVKYVKSKCSVHGWTTTYL